MATIDKYKNLQETIAKRKANLQAQWATATQAILPDAQATPVVTPEPVVETPAQPEPVTPTPSVETPVTPPAPVTPTPAVPPLAPVATTTPPAPVTPTKTPEQEQAERYKAYTDAKKIRLQTQADNKLKSNMSLYSTGKSLYDAVQWGSILPWTKEFSDLTTQNPTLLAEYNAEKDRVNKINTVNTLGDAILGNTIETKPSNALDSLMAYFTKAMDTDVATEYKNAVINNPEYQSSVQKYNTINSQIAENNKNIQALSDDVRKKYSAWTPESLIASAIARDAKPLIQNGQYLSELQTNAQAEMSRIFDENKEMFALKQEERNAKNQRMIELYGTLRNEEIRQEDFARAEEKIINDRNYTEEQRKTLLEDNLKLAITWLGITPKWQTYDELLGEYATAVKNQPKESKTITWLKAWDYYLDNWVLTQVPTGGMVWGTQPSGNLISINAGNKNVQVDEVGATWLQNAFNEMQSNGIKFLTWAAHRDQAETIKAMGDRVGMPWATAAQLRAAWHQIADVGKSNHEGGMAIDLYSDDKLSAPTQAQVEIMERNWWRQWTANWPIPWDLWHFEYVWKVPLSKDQQSKIIWYQKSLAWSEPVKNWKQIQWPLKWIESVENVNLNGSDIQGLISNYAKVLDPDSVVREWEYAIAQSGASKGVADRVRQEMRTYMFGGSEVLSKEAQTVLKDALKRRFNSLKTAYQEEVGKQQVIIEQTLGIPVTEKMLVGEEFNNDIATQTEYSQDDINELLSQSSREEVVKFLLSKWLDPSNYNFGTQSKTVDYIAS